MLTVKQRILVDIYQHNLANTPAHFGVILDDLPDVSKQDVNEMLDKLTKMCIIDSTWKEYNDIWYRSYFITGNHITYVKDILAEMNRGEK